MDIEDIQDTIALLYKEIIGSDVPNERLLSNIYNICELLIQSTDRIKSLEATYQISGLGMSENKELRFHMKKAIEYLFVISEFHYWRIEDIIAELEAESYKNLETRNREYETTEDDEYGDY